MEQTAETDHTPRVVILFDACATNMEECTPGRCENNTTILCTHRFDFNSYILNGIHGSNYLSSVRLSDFQVILHLLYFITKNRVPRPGCAKYVIVTKDKEFLQSAENELQAKSKKRTAPKLDFGPGFVRNGKIVIHIEYIKHKTYGSNRHDDRAAVIDQLNNLFGRPAS